MAVFRKKNSNPFSYLDPTVIATNKPENIDPDLYDILTYFQIKPILTGNTYRLEFSDSKDFKKKNKKNERVNTDESNDSYEAKEQTYMVVSKIKDINDNQLGYKLGTSFKIQVSAKLLSSAESSILSAKSALPAGRPSRTPNTNLPTAIGKYFNSLPILPAKKSTLARFV